MNSNNYVPDKQDIIQIDFDPSVGKEIKKRRLALVMSNKGYSEITGLVVISPITHADNNRLKNFFVPISSSIVDGYVNPLQFFTYDFRKRKAKKIETLPSDEFAKARQMIFDILS